jgi:hypothetical protein
MNGNSVSTPTTLAGDALEVKPKTVVATATARVERKGSQGSGKTVSVSTLSYSSSLYASALADVPAIENEADQYTDQLSKSTI